MRRVQCLKYLVLANMLMESLVDPFDAQEAKPYKNDSQVLAMTDLVQAYQRNDISAFEKILKTNRRVHLKACDYDRATEGQILVLEQQLSIHCFS